MNRRLSMFDLWASYRAMVIPANAPDVQISECRRAFYAGAKGLLDAVMLALDPSRDPTEADIEYMGKLQKELHTFGMGVMTGAQ